MIQLPELNPDEWLAGYIGRVARMNSVSRNRVWHEFQAMAGSSSWPSARKTWASPLAEALQLSIPEVMTEHTLEPLLRALYPTLPGSGAKADPYNLHAIQIAEVATPDRLLRLCPACVREDIGFWGFSYWRRSHQIPGIRWCAKHDGHLLDVADRLAVDLFPEECQTNERSMLTYEHSAPVRRYADFCAGLLEMGVRVPVVQARFRMRRRAISMGVRTSILGSRTNVSDKVLEVFPSSWLTTLIPDIGAKKLGSHFPAIDSVCRSGSKPASGIAYALVVSSLYDCADMALMDISRSLTEIESAEVADLCSPSSAGLRSNRLRWRDRQVWQETAGVVAPR